MQNRMAEFVELCCNSPEPVVTLKTGLCRSERRPEKSEIRPGFGAQSLFQINLQPVNNFGDAYEDQADRPS
jgi:hypothetical protein